MRWIAALLMMSAPAMAQQAEPSRQLALTAQIAPDPSVTECDPVTEAPFRIVVPERVIRPAVDGGPLNMTELTRGHSYIVQRSGSERIAVPIDLVSEPETDAPGSPGYIAGYVADMEIEDYSLGLEGELCVAPFRTRFVEIEMSLDTEIGRGYLNANFSRLLSYQRAFIHPEAAEEISEDIGLRITAEMRGSVTPLIGLVRPVEVMIRLPMDLTLDFPELPVPDEGSAIRFVSPEGSPSGGTPRVRAAPSGDGG